MRVRPDFSPHTRLLLPCANPIAADLLGALGVQLGRSGGGSGLGSLGTHGRAAPGHGHGTAGAGALEHGLLHGDVGLVRTGQVEGPSYPWASGEPVWEVCESEFGMDVNGRNQSLGLNASDGRPGVLPTAVQMRQWHRLLLGCSWPPCKVLHAEQLRYAFVQVLPDTRNLQSSLSSSARNESGEPLIHYCSPSLYLPTT